MATSMDRAAGMIAIEPASAALGVRVEGIDLAEGADSATIDELRTLLHRHHLVVLPAQRLSAVELEAFGRRFGELLTHPSGGHHDSPHVQFIGGRDRVNRFFPGAHPFGGGWHSDMTWHPTPPIITGLHAQRMPARGGDTAFANQQAAYRALDEKTRASIGRLQAYHTGKVFGADVEDSVHPVVRTHDVSGERALYVNPNFTSHVLGLPSDESEALLYRLFAHAVRPEFTYRHAWSVGDLVLWDNRSVMHYAISDYTETRILHRIVVQGGKPE